jgi:hypothetical protein
MDSATLLQGYKLADAEAQLLLPCLVEKAGHSQVSVSFCTPAPSDMHGLFCPAGGSTDIQATAPAVAACRSAFVRSTGSC